MQELNMLNRVRKLCLIIFLLSIVGVGRSQDVDSAWLSVDYSQLIGKEWSSVEQDLKDTLLGFSCVPLKPKPYYVSGLHFSKGNYEVVVTLTVEAKVAKDREMLKCVYWDEYFASYTILEVVILHQRELVRKHSSIK